MTAEPPDPSAYLAGVIDHARYWSAQLDRPDLTSALDACTERLASVDGATIVLVGLSDGGKTTLLAELAEDDTIVADPLRPTPRPVVVHGPEVASHETRSALDHDVHCSTPWPRPSGLLLVDTPSNGLPGAVRDATSGAEPDILLLVTDAAQELSALEIDIARNACARGARLVVALTKVDLHHEWRRILQIDREHLMAAGLKAAVFPVSARLHALGRHRSDQAMRAESGVPDLAASLDRLNSRAATAAARTAAASTVVESVGGLLTTLRLQRAVLTDPAAGRALAERLEASRARLDLVRSGSSKWREKLYDGLERLQLETDHDLRVRMTRLQTEAMAELEASDPSEIWTGFATRLHRSVEDEVGGLLEALEGNGRQLALEVAQLFGDEQVVDADELAITDVAELPRAIFDPIMMDEGQRDTTGTVVNALRGSAMSASMTGILAKYGAIAVGGAVVQSVLLPLGAGMAVVLGRQALRATRHSQLQTRRRAAAVSVRKYLDGMSPEVAVRVRTDLMNLRLRLRDTFDQRATALAYQVESELRSTLEALKAGEDQRSERLTNVDGLLTKLEELAEHARLARRAVMESDE